MRKILLFLLLFPLFLYGQNREEVYFENSIFKGVYSEVLEQPLWVEYTVQCPDGSASRRGMDFYTNDSIHTSDGKDYAHNIYDKGHLAPAADFNCTRDMLYMTFSYLNCALQDQYMNRGEWRMLEEQERKWDDNENLTVTVELVFAPNHIVLSTGGHVPTTMVKHIYFEKSKKYMCYEFPNVKPEKGWEEHIVSHKH